MHDDAHFRAAPLAHGRASGIDVARLAGVSQKTVSRVMNGALNVRPEVAARVQRAARQLNYRLNAAARALNTGRTHRIGLVTLGTAQFGPSSLLLAIETAARNAGYSVALASTTSGDGAEVLAAVHTVLEQGVDGLIISEPLEAKAATIGIDVPIVWVGRPGPGWGESFSVEIDTEESAYELTKHMLTLGHSTVWHISGPASWVTSKPRELGWRKALREAGAPIPEPLEGDWGAGSGHRIASEVLIPAGASAVLAGNDEMAIGVIRAAREHGLEVPRDLSVAGIDDIPLAAYVHPPLTTARQDFEKYGEVALDLLLSALAGAAVDKSDVLIPTRLIVRASTGPPPALAFAGRRWDQSATTTEGGSQAD